MTAFLSLALEGIRRGGSFMSWIENHRLEWAPLMAARLGMLLDGRSFVLVCDKERGWFENYFLSQVNAKPERPMVPFFSLDSLLRRRIESAEDIAFLNDLLDLTFPDGFVYFYIGKSSDKRAAIAKSRDDSLLWLFDEQLQNSFFLDSRDRDLDFKLIGLYKLFDTCLEAILFAEVEL